MNRLIDDLFVRRLSQVLLIFFSAALCAICLCFDVIAIGAYYGRFSVDDNLVYQFMKTLQFSYRSDASPFLTAFIGIFPVLVSSVCYSVEEFENTKKITDKLNITGHIFLLMLLGGLALSASAIFVLQALHETINDLTPIKDHSPKSVFTAIISFEAMYLVQLMGLRPK